MGRQIRNIYDIIDLNYVLYAPGDAPARDLRTRAVSVIEDLRGSEMFENASHLHFIPARFEKGLKTLREVIVPILKAQPGLLSLAIIPDQPGGRVTILSVWRSQAYARAVESQCEYRREIQRLDAWLTSPTPPVSAFPTEPQRPRVSAN
jgi:hypothetical protein